MSLLALLFDLDAFCMAAPQERAALTTELLARLGPRWSRDLLPATTPLPAATLLPDSASLANRPHEPLRLRHLPSGLSFAVIAGGQFTMGLTEQDIEDASEHIDWTSGVAADVAQIARPAQPPRLVRVRPLLCSCRLLLDNPSQYVMAERARAELLAQRWELRLPSEAELEWIFRDGAEQAFILAAAERFAQGADETQLPSRFGVRDVFCNQWCADDWHDSYDGAPDTSTPWRDSNVSGTTGDNNTAAPGRDGHNCGVMRSGFSLVGIQHPAELLDALAARRRPGRAAAAVRLACDIPLDS